MPRGLPVLMVWLSACGAVRATDVAPQQVPGDGGALVSDCADDTDCPGGMVCEGCGAGSLRQCIPGCRRPEQCPTNMTCLSPVQCLSCPCAPGWCDLDPCRDVDGDGFVPKSLVVVDCPGKQQGDCDDARSTVHPGGVELCGNGLDDDCNGRLDQQDSAVCDTCTSGSFVCRSALHCRVDERCARGCCLACPPQPEPTCGTGECRHEGPLEANGCRPPATCVGCTSCTAYAPVCGEDFATWDSACLANAHGVAVLHSGACRLKEGLPCEPGEWCGYDGYCGRSTERCTWTQACVVDEDCGFARSEGRCDAGVARVECVDHRCRPVCK